MESRKQFEIEHYDREARQWQSLDSEKKWETDVHGVRHHLFLSYQFCDDWIRAHVAGKRLLDYGCGTGIHSILPAQEGAEVVGIDLSEASLQIARERARRAHVETQVEFIKMDCEALTFPDNSFDLIFDGGVFSSIDFDKALSELARVLKPDGALLGIETFGHNPLTNLKRKWNEWRGSRTTWAAEHIMKRESIKKARLYFDAIDVHYFHLTSLFALPFVKFPGGAFLFKLFDRLDRFLLKLPFLKNYAFKIVFVFSKPKKL